ncbi:hypothetical protein FHETE_8269 [Fusarium heterosporum]|uniref:Uncharacterized protein n=1 Tax=Fusarium heterosporum TaxID=42747 RepID=A0A8H5WKD9_FUSHE|nr:hypothetical protein FHETE_8269 [Fusarium heterosporum]
MANAVHPATPYYCITQARCRLCQFLPEDGEPIVVDIGDDGISCEISFYWRTTFYDDELDIKLHMCLADECGSRPKATLWPRKLPTELWAMVAGLLLRDCATFTAQEQVDGCNSDNAADITLDLNQPVYATYVRIDGRAYIKALGHEARNETKTEISIRLSTPIIQDGNANKNIFVAEDYLGICRIFFVSPKYVEQWCRAPPRVPGAWWKHLP